MKTILFMLVTIGGLFLLWPDGKPDSESKPKEPLAVCLLQIHSEVAPQNGCPLFSETDFEQLMVLRARMIGQ